MAFLIRSVLTLLCALLAGASQATDAPISIRDAWIRWLPGDIPAGGYLTVVNSSDHRVSLLQASSPAYAQISLHQTRMSSGMTEMVPLTRLDIAPNSTLRFESAGYHLMLERPTRTIVPGDHVTVALRFDSGHSITVTFDVHQPSDGESSGTSMERSSTKTSPR